MEYDLSKDMIKYTLDKMLLDLGMKAVIWKIQSKNLFKY